MRIDLCVVRLALCPYYQSDFCTFATIHDMGGGGGGGYVGTHAPSRAEFKICGRLTGFGMLLDS